MSDTTEERRYPPRTRLADCVICDDGPDLETILDRVRQGLEELKQEYLSEARDELDKLSAAVSRARHSDGAKRSEAISRGYLISHDLRGVAGSFDYPLVTRLGSSLCDVIERLDTVSSLELEIIDLHVGAMKVIMSGQMTGNGGVKARELVNGIDAAVRKCIQAPAVR